MNARAIDLRIFEKVFFKGNRVQRFIFDALILKNGPSWALATGHVVQYNPLFKKSSATKFLPTLTQ